MQRSRTIPGLNILTLGWERGREGGGSDEEWEEVLPLAGCLGKA